MKLQVSFTLALSCVLSGAQVPKAFYTNRYQYDQRVLAKNPFEAVPTTWAKAPWNNQGDRFRKIRVAVDRILSTGSVSNHLVRFATDANQSPRDSERQFKWAYAFFAVQQPKESPMMNIQRATPFRLALADIPDAQNVEVMRLRFLIEGRYFARRSSDLVFLGKRLLTKYPKDESVSFAASQFLMRSPAPTDRNVAVTLTSKLVQTRGDRPGRWLALGNAYMFRYFSDKKKGDAELAVGAFDKYLSLLPPHLDGGSVRRIRDRLRNDIQD